MTSPSQSLWLVCCVCKLPLLNLISDASALVQKKNHSSFPVFLPSNLPCTGLVFPCCNMLGYSGKRHWPLIVPTHKSFFPGVHSLHLALAPSDGTSHHRVLLPQSQCFIQIIRNAPPLFGCSAGWVPKESSFSGMSSLMSQFDGIF